MKTNADWEQVKANHHVGSEVSGQVVHCASFGIFLDLGLGFHGLLEITEFADRSWTRGVEFYPPVGTTITAWVLQHMESNQQLRLTQRSMSEEDWDRLRQSLNAPPHS